MKIYLSAFADEAAKEFTEQMKSLNENNIKYVELRKLDGMNISGISVEKAREYRKILDEYGISVWSLGSPLAKQFYRKSLDFELDMANHLCNLADVFDCKNIRAFSFRSILKKHGSDIIIPKLRKISETVSARQINYCLENDTGLYADVPERIEEVLNCISEMKYIYDPANFIMSGCKSDETLLRLCDRAYYFHVKDAKGKRILPSGYGDANIPKLVKMIDRDCVCTIEPHLFVYRGNGDSFISQFDVGSQKGRFNLAVAAFKKILESEGFVEKDGYFEKQGL